MASKHHNRIYSEYGELLHADRTMSWQWWMTNGFLSTPHSKVVLDNGVFLRSTQSTKRKRKKNSQMLAALVVQTLEQMFSAKQAYILPYVHLPRLTPPVNLHQLFLFWKHGSVRDPEKNQVQTLGCKNQGEKKQGHSKRVDAAWPFSFWITTTLFFDVVVKSQTSNPSLKTIQMAAN